MTVTWYLLQEDAQWQSCSHQPQQRGKMQRGSNSPLSAAFTQCAGPTLDVTAC